MGGAEPSTPDPGETAYHDGQQHQGPYGGKRQLDGAGGSAETSQEKSGDEDRVDYQHCRNQPEDLPTEPTTLSGPDFCGASVRLPHPFASALRAELSSPGRMAPTGSGLPAMMRR